MANDEGPHAALDNGTKVVLATIREHTGYEYPKGVVALARLLRIIDENLPLAQAEEFEAALPKGVREAMLDDEPGPGFGPESFNLDTIESHIASECAVDSDRAYQLVTTIFDAVRKVIDPETMETVAAKLPIDIRQQWLGLRH